MPLDQWSETPEVVGPLRLFEHRGEAVIDAELFEAAAEDPLPPRPVREARAECALPDLDHPEVKGWLREAGE
jgi:hypothetical protein